MRGAPEARGRPGAALGPVPPPPGSRSRARPATEPSLGRRTAALVVPPGSGPTPLSAPSPARAPSRRPRRGIRARRTRRAGSLGPGVRRAAYPGGKRCCVLPKQPTASVPWTRVRKSVLLVWDEPVLTAPLCPARGLPPARAPSSHSCLCLGEKPGAPLSLKHEKQILVMDKESDLDCHVCASE